MKKKTQYFINHVYQGQFKRLKQVNKKKLSSRQQNTTQQNTAGNLKTNLSDNDLPTWKFTQNAHFIRTVMSTEGRQNEKSEIFVLSFLKIIL